ncbi:e3 ubiquitin-protein ligase [Klebsormidium nitens]|uniref:E3 ubiquitin-protein ligase n=1 Tax=Klebsormidium nitens TaxID=105231 RepID=A0A1Y1HZD6_KLENI|nr:e3 ubiquitin-protein ligase [Klebsormidium nitens]|eukprot:GAQ83102.1 e3 ubiquitin-protein ligase [Klebsormidium nitens]
MAGNYGAPIDLTDSPQERVANRHQVAVGHILQGPANPRNIAPPAIHPQGLAIHVNAAQMEHLHEEAAQRARDAAQRARDAAQRTRDAAQRARDAAQRMRDEAQRTREAAQRTREAAQMQAGQARRLARDERLERQRNAVREGRLAQNQAQLHREAVEANARRQAYLRQQRERVPAAGEVHGEGPEEWEQRRRRVAEDIERRLQERAARRQQALADAGPETPEDVMRGPQQVLGLLRGGHRRQADDGGARGGEGVGENGDEMRGDVRGGHRRQADEGGRGGVGEAVDEGLLYRLQDLQEIVARNEIQERGRKRARHDEGGTGGGLTNVEVLERNIFINRERVQMRVEPVLGDHGAGPSGRGADVGGERNGGVVAEALSNLAEIFPEVDLEAAREALFVSIAEHGMPRGLEVVTNTYFENGYPKREQPKVDTPPQDGAGPSKQEEKDVFALGSPPRQCAPAYHKWAVYQLQVDFPRVSLTDVRRCLKVHGERYAPAYKSILTEVQKICLSGAEGKGKAIAEESPQKSTHDSKAAYWAPNFKLLQKPRPKPRHMPDEECFEFQEELERVRRAGAKDQELEDMLLAEKLNEEEYAGEGQEIECGCCYSEYPFEKMVQCAEGHLFCFACLKRRVEESTFGAAAAGGSLPCMDTDGCEAEFPYAEVRRALPEATLAKYEARQTEQALLSAKLDNLVRCPFCDFACEVDEGNRVLDCPGCKKASCRECKEASHIPLKCSEVEKKGETAFRTRVEELMTRALVRECSKCKTELIKDHGCNKVTCRCGQTMCYVCRAPIPPDYTHFCQHFREPDRKCNQCSKCNLYTTGNDAAEVKRVRTTAIAEAAHLDPEAAKKMIGAPDDLPQAQAKRPRLYPPGHPLAGLVF